MLSVRQVFLQFYHSHLLNLHINFYLIRLSVYILVVTFYSTRKKYYVSHYENYMLQTHSEFFTLQLSAELRKRAILFT